jgi:hypothetical protein
LGSNPLNLAIRFLLEIAGLVALGFWGWSQSEGLLRVVLALGIPSIAAVLWGTFAVPDDPSRSGKAPVPVSGIIRLLLELAFFGLSTWSILDNGNPFVGWLFGLVVLVHYLISYDRVLWLIKR